MRRIIGGEINILPLASHNDLYRLLCHVIVIVLYINNVNVEENNVCFILKKKKKAHRKNCA